MNQTPSIIGISDIQGDHRATLGVGVSGIMPDESVGFINDKAEMDKLFGTGNIGPDRIRLMSNYGPKNPHSF